MYRRFDANRSPLAAAIIIPAFEKDLRKIEFSLLNPPLYIKCYIVYYIFKEPPLVCHKKILNITEIKDLRILSQEVLHVPAFFLLIDPQVYAALNKAYIRNVNVFTITSHIVILSGFRDFQFYY